MSSAAATACTRTPRCRLRRTAASLNSALYSWTFFGPARGTRHLPLLGGSVYKSEAGSPVSFKRLLGGERETRRPNDAQTCCRASRSKLRDLRRGPLPECRLGSRGGLSSAPTRETPVGAYLQYQHRSSSCARHDQSAAGR